MDTIHTPFTIQEAAQQTGLTVHTLRYYERIGLLMPVGRAENGHRRYSQQDIIIIQMLHCWLLTGMPLDDIRCFIKLSLQGESTLGERRTLLEVHREKVAKQMEELQATLQLIDFKIHYYKELEQKQEKVLS